MEIVNSNPQNIDKVNGNPRHSLFPLERHVYGTFRFGEYSPFFYFDGVGSDKISQRSVTTTRSLSLNAPLMEDVYMKRDYFAVYYDAILPLNWDKVYVNPKKGDDVPYGVSCVVYNFPYKVARFLGNFKQSIDNAYDDDDDVTNYPLYLMDYLRWLALLEMFFSQGCLLSTLGVHLSDGISVFNAVHAQNTFEDVDSFVNSVLYDILNFKGISAISSSDEDRSIILNSAIGVRTFMQYVRDGEHFSFGPSGKTSAQFNEYIIQLLDELKACYCETVFHSDDDTFVDLARPISYQLACAHFYSNDNVDYLFSANLYREYVSHLISLIIGYVGESFKDYSFSYNGIDYFLDSFSSGYFDAVINNFAIHSVDGAIIGDATFSYFRSIFGFNRSLRYKDYFVGAKTQPLAVGDTSISVSDGKVSVIDVTKNIQFQRFLNFVNRIPLQIDGYVKSMFGSDVSFDYHNPAWLAETSDIVYTAEVENTGAAQQSNPNSITANFKASSNDKQFTFECDKPCIIIGIQSFDIRRAYFSGIDRLVQHEDRYEGFIPELQFIGDQPVYGSELACWYGRWPISYQGRNEEYKQVTDQCFGGFTQDSLRSWAFSWAYEDFIKLRGYSPDQGNLRISPDFIRSLNVELDRYFLSLTSFSLGTYFHFIQKIVNVTEARRPMVKNPQILG